MATENREVYNNALVHIGQSSYSTDIGDYESRAPYLIAAFCSTVRSLDKQLRRMDGLEEQPSFSPVCIPLGEKFPLCDRLIPAAALYVASLLVIDEDSELSDSLYDKYCDNIASIAAATEAGSGNSSGGSFDGVPGATCESIKDIYFFD